MPRRNRYRGRANAARYVPYNERLAASARARWRYNNPPAALVRAAMRNIPRLPGRDELYRGHRNYRRALAVFRDIAAAGAALTGGGRFLYDKYRGVTTKTKTPFGTVRVFTKKGSYLRQGSTAQSKTRRTIENNRKFGAHRWAFV